MNPQETRGDRGTWSSRSATAASPSSSSSTTCGSSSTCATGCCASSGAEARRGHARRGPVRRPGHRRLPRSRRRRGGGERVTALLEVEDLEVSYGKIKAVKGISFDVDEGEVVTLIGTNGAGKTTTLRTISGLLRPAAGSITFEGKRPHHGPRPQHRRSSAWPTPPRAGRSSRGSPSRRTSASAPSSARTRASTPTSTRLRAVPDPRGAPQAGGRHLLRRRAADARHGPGDDEPAQAAHARRAVDGPLPADDAEDHDARSSSSSSRAPPSCSSSRTPRPRCRSPTRATSWRSATSSSPAPAQDLLASDDVRKAYLGED